jgi:cold shock CspA family protein
LALSRTSALLSRLLAASDISRLLTKEITMKYFGTVKSFDTIKGHGEIKQEAGGNDLRFETSAIQWDKNVAPTVGQRLSYDVGQTSERQPCALNLQTI